MAELYSGWQQNELAPASEDIGKLNGSAHHAAAPDATSGAMLRRALAAPAIARVVGVHDALSSRVAQVTRCDALWASGLGIAASHGKPDASVLTMSEVRDAAALIVRASRLPVICDCDTGFGGIRTLRRVIAEFEGAGAAAVCLEDKQHPKRNSFLPGQMLLDPWEFAAKIQVAKETQRTKDFMVFARLESLIAGAGLTDALARGKLYADAGADALVVHSKAPTADEVLEFAARWHSRGYNTPLVVVPTTYARTSSAELEAGGLDMVIYANQALRASVRAMMDALIEIQSHGSSGPIEAELAPVTSIFELTGEDAVKYDDERFQRLVTERRDAWHASEAAR
jgi:phosphoenolpyruvate phosphomutase